MSDAVDLPEALIQLVEFVARPEERPAEFVERAVRCQLERERGPRPFVADVPPEIERRAELEAEYFGVPKEARYRELVRFAED